MSHDNHVIDGINQDLTFHSKEWYLKATEGWEDPYGLPKVEVHHGIRVVRDDLIVGSKCRFADLLISRTEEDTIVYVQPRFGLAGVSILEVAKRYKKNVVLFMPSSKAISEHQAVCIERGAIPKFRRIAAMPNLNRLARIWAKANGAAFIPLGLKHQLVTACAVRVVENLKREYEDPSNVWCAISTGVLSRALQIGWDRSKHSAVAVARNLKAGELGNATVVSDSLAFASPEKPMNLPPFPTVPNYDGKVWKYIPKNGWGHWIWNVGRDPILVNESIYMEVDSYRDWGEVRD